jgi:hypothetical protein
MGEGTQKQIEQRLGEGKGSREDGDREGDTKMRRWTQIVRLSTASDTALQASWRLPLPPEPPGDMQDLPRRIWIREQIV